MNRRKSIWECPVCGRRYARIVAVRVPKTDLIQRVQGSIRCQCGEKEEP